MQIRPVTRRKHLLYPLAAVVVLSGCGQKQRVVGQYPASTPEIQVESVPKPLEGRQLLPGRAKGQPLPGKRRTSP